MSGGIPAFISFARADLSLREQRQGLVAANISNANTPGYQAVDINFGKDLAAALHDGAPATGEVQYLKDFPAGLDGNDVSMTAEKLESMQNTGAMGSEITYLHQATTDLITALRPNQNGI